MDPIQLAAVPRSIAYEQNHIHSHTRPQPPRPSTTSSIIAGKGIRIVNPLASWYEARVEQVLETENPLMTFFFTQSIMRKSTLKTKPTPKTLTAVRAKSFRNSILFPNALQCVGSFRQHLLLSLTVVSALHGTDVLSLHPPYSLDAFPPNYFNKGLII